MTKVQAVAQLLKDKGEKASWKEIYDAIEKYYPAAKASDFWEEGIRGVVYREIRYGRAFKMDGEGIVALKA